MSFNQTFYFFFLKVSVPSNSTELSSLRTTFKSPNYFYAQSLLLRSPTLAPNGALIACVCVGLQLFPAIIFIIPKINLD